MELEYILQEPTTPLNYLLSNLAMVPRAFAGETILLAAVELR